MNRRTLWIAGGAVALILALLALGLTLRKRISGTNTNLPTGSVSNVTTVDIPGTNDAAARGELETIRRVAIVVAERSSSGPVSKANARLLTAVDELTPSLAIFARAQATRPSKPLDPELYAAAKVLAQETTERTDIKATVTVTLQIVTTTAPGASGGEVAYRKVRLGLQKLGSEWKVGEVVDLGPVNLGNAQR